MSHTLTILGCGYVGTALLNLLWKTSGRFPPLTRNPQTGEELEDLGVQNVVVSRLDSDEWHSYLDSKQDFVVNCVGAASFTEDGYVTSYIEGTEIRHEMVGKLGRVVNFVFTSSCSVYPQTGRKLVDEKDRVLVFLKRGTAFSNGGNIISTTCNN